MPKKQHTHRSLCRLTAKWLLKQSWCDVVSWELKYNNGFVDVIGLTAPSKHKDQRIVAIEVKRTKPDLVQDVKSGKYMKYQMNSTHCYIAGTREAFGIRSTRQKQKAFTMLKELGLPRSWGVILLPTSGYRNPIILRRPKRIGKVLPGLLEDLTFQIAKSFANRILNHKSPLNEST